MTNQSFSKPRTTFNKDKDDRAKQTIQKVVRGKIWIMVIIAIFITGGILAWHYQ